MAVAQDFPVSLAAFENRSLSYKLQVVGLRAEGAWDF